MVLIRSHSRILRQMEIVYFEERVAIDLMGEWMNYE